MVQVLEDVDFVLHSDALLIVELELVDDLDSALLSIRLESGLLDLTEGALAEDIVVQIVFLHEHARVLVLNDEVLVRSNHFLLVLIGYLLFDLLESILTVALAAALLFGAHAIAHD